MMCISTKGRYALRVVTFLAEWPGRPLTKTEISEAEQVTPGYLQQIMGTLLSAGIVKSYRGKAGGFSLARDPETITVGEVLRCTEGRVEPVPCDDADECARADHCATRPFWLRVMRAVNELLDSTTIADLLRDRDSEAAGLLLPGAPFLAGDKLDGAQRAHANALPACSARR